MVRRYVNPVGAVAGFVQARSFTVLDVSPEPWRPELPDATVVSPLTASALVELAL